MTTVTLATSGGAVTAVDFTFAPIRSFLLNLYWFHFRYTNCHESSTSYTVTASNTGGSATAIYHPSEHCRTVVHYVQSEFSDPGKGVAMSIDPDPGRPVSSWSISPSLPSGLAFPTSTGAISEHQPLFRRQPLTP